MMNMFVIENSVSIASDKTMKMDSIKMGFAHFAKESVFVLGVQETI